MDDIRPGAQVYDCDGDYVGTVEAVGDGLVRIRAGTIASPIYYVPQGAVIGSLPGDHEVFLSVEVNALDGMGWLHPPHGRIPTHDPFAPPRH